MNNLTLFSHDNSYNHFLADKNLINLKMTEAEYNQAVSDGCLGIISEKTRIIIHEYTHWIQSAGSPYGFYLALIHHFENKLLREMEELIAERLYNLNSIKISPPFKEYIQNKLFYNIHDDILWNLFSQWIDLYFFIMAMEKRRDLYFDFVKEQKDFLTSYTQCNNMKNIENFMFLPLLFHRVDNFLDSKLSEFVGNPQPVKKILERKDFFSKENLAVATGSILNGISLNITHQSMWESFATAVEFADVPEEFMFPSHTDSYGKRKKWNKYYDPLRHLEKYLTSANHNKELFLKSCILLFDIVFSPPALPQCKIFRKKEFSMFDFDIVSRFYAVAEAARYIGPLNNFSSAAEYSNTICSVLNWYNPDTMFLQARRCWDSLNIIPEGKMFQYFINTRISGEYITLNRKRFLDEISLNHINPCFLKLNDKIIINTSCSYTLGLDAYMDLMMNNAFLKLDDLSPEPLNYDYEYYQYYLLRELIETIWDKNDKIIKLKIPKECENTQKIQSYLQSWIDEHFIDVKIFLEKI